MSYIRGAIIIGIISIISLGGISCTGHDIDGNVQDSSLNSGDVDIDGGGIIRAIIDFLTPFSVCQTFAGSCRVSKSVRGESCGCLFPNGAFPGRVQ